MSFGFLTSVGRNPGISLKPKCFIYAYDITEFEFNTLKLFNLIYNYAEQQLPSDFWFLWRLLRPLLLSTMNKCKRVTSCVGDPMIIRRWPWPSNILELLTNVFIRSMWSQPA